MRVKRVSANTNLLALLYPLTEGNPFFVEEVLTSLVSWGELRADEGNWQRKARPEREEKLCLFRFVSNGSYNTWCR